MTDIIRNDVNYGNLVVVELAGKQFLIQDRYAEMLKLPIVEAEEIPEFNPELTIRVLFPNGVTQAWAYVQANPDVRVIAIALSKHTGFDVRVCGYARILAIYVDGKLTSENKITEFYSNLTPQDIGKVSF
jgi:hypothetical protein